MLAIVFIISLFSLISVAEAKGSTSQDCVSETSKIC